jgi:hypothetical protein
MKKPPQRRTWGPHGQRGYSLEPTMHHYRCQNRVNTLDFSPHNSPMPKISSVDWLPMAAYDITDTLKQPQPDVPFANIGDDTITALSQLSAIFKNKLKKPLAPEISQSRIKAAEKIPATLLQHVLTSPVKHNYKTRLQTQVNPTAPASVIESQNLQQLLRVATPAVRSASPPRVPARARNLSRRNFSQDDLLDMGSANQDIALGKKHWTNMKMVNAVIHPFTWKKCNTWIS